jgi:putative flavoprotein involved in K+ transport
MADKIDVVVVGAGQAGLAIGYFLKQHGLTFVILEARDSIGAAWRDRWDSLTLFTPRRYNSLPGLEFPGNPDGYPGRDEVIAYLERHAETFALPVELGSEVRAVTASGEAYRVDVDDGRAIAADQVVIATGPYQVPYVPEFASRLSPEVVHVHSTGYRNAAGLPEGTVLVVGGGNTGFQIAEELAATRDVHLAIGSRQLPLPQRWLGKDLFWWLTKVGLLQKTVESRVGRRLRDRGSPLIGSSVRALRRHGVIIRSRAIGVDGRTVHFEDGTTLDVEAVVWATGYRTDHAWIRPSVTDDEGRLRHRRGVTELPGLYFIGQDWQHTRGSALLGWVKEDAEFIADQVAVRRRTDGDGRPSDPQRVPVGDRAER